MFVYLFFQSLSNQRQSDARTLQSRKIENDKLLSSATNKGGGKPGQ